MKNPKRNIVWADGYISPDRFEEQNGHKSGVLWFTGLSGSGKSTLARALQHRLFGMNYRAFVLDGDNIRHGLNADLGFGEQDRRENIRRVSEVAHLFQQAGFIVLTAFISPFREDRRRARRVIEPAPFIEVFVDADLSVCRQRDPKGLYEKALKGEIKDFTGISSSYEVPEHPELTLSTAEDTIEESTDRIFHYLKESGWFSD